MINKIKLQIRSQPFHIFLPCHISSSCSVAFKIEVFCVLWRQRKAEVQSRQILDESLHRSRPHIECDWKKKQELREIQLFLFSQSWGRRKRSFSMVQSLEIRFAFCVRLTNNDNFLADKRADGGKVLKDNVWEKKKKSNGIIKRKTRTSWSLVCCVFWGHSGPLAWKLQERKGNE